MSIAHQGGQVISIAGACVPGTGPESEPAVAVFDFDGTLTRSDSLLPFLKYIAGVWRFYGGLIVLSPVLLGYVLRLIPNDLAKRWVLAYFLRGMTTAELAPKGRRFAEEVLPGLLRPEAVERLQWHRAQGHRTVLVSASLEVYLQPWGRAMGFDHVLGTRLAVKGARLTGHFDGENCYGPQKVERLTSWLGDLSQHDLYAYGDSSGDRELLAVATTPYYRSFGDDPSEASADAAPRWERGLALTAALAAALYLGIVLWSGAGNILEALGQLPWWLIPLVLLIVLASFWLLFLR